METIVTEALLLAALGTAFGILAGLYLSYVFVQGLNAGGFMKMAYTFPLAGVLGGHCGGADLWRARRADARGPGIEHGDHQGAAVRIVETTDLSEHDIARVSVGGQPPSLIRDGPFGALPARLVVHLKDLVFSLEPV